jgi:PKHD-type hydroxylase
MSYINIYNYTEERSNVTFPFVYWNGLFTNNELNVMCKYFKQNLEYFEGRTMGVDSDILAKDIRISKIKFFTPVSENQWIFERLNVIIQKLNNDYYCFNLNGYDMIQYGEYDSKESGKYDWHMDMRLGKNSKPEPTRKLSLSLLLNEPGVDFEGGKFQINDSMESRVQDVEMKKGTIIAFPSFMLHRVTPVTKGIRKSLVIWVTGPKFT